MAPPAAPSMQETPQGASSLASSKTGTGTSDSVGSPSVNSGTNGVQGSTASPSATPLSDDQILYVLHAANLAEMDQARIAQKKGKNGRVKRFAAMMLKHHGEADAKGNEVAKKTNASLTPSETSHRLESDAKQVSSNIATPNGTDFDRVYIDGQVKEHRALLDAIDREFLPAVRSSDVKDLLQTVRARVESHLQEAEQIQKGLGG
jgi:putative membrane protein